MTKQNLPAPYGDTQRELWGGVSPETLHDLGHPIDENGNFIVYGADGPQSPDPQEDTQVPDLVESSSEATAEPESTKMDEHTKNLGQLMVKQLRENKTKLNVVSNSTGQKKSDVHLGPGEMADAMRKLRGASELMVEQRRTGSNNTRQSARRTRRPRAA